MTLKAGDIVYIRATIKNPDAENFTVRVGETDYRIPYGSVFAEPRPFKKLDVVSETNTGRIGLVLGVHDDLLWVSWEDDTFSTCDTSAVELDIVASRRSGNELS